MCELLKTLVYAGVESVGFIDLKSFCLIRDFKIELNIKLLSPDITWY